MSPAAPAVLGNDRLSHFDVLVIGSGAGGGPLAFVLASHGMKVLVLEAGPNRFSHLDDPNAQPVPRFSNDELKFSNRGFIVSDPLVDPRTWRTSTSDGDRLSTGAVNPLPKTVGGGAVHADLKAPRFMPQDFRLGTLLPALPGASFADWPVDYDMLEPFYSYVEYALGVQGLAGANPFEAARSRPFPMAPGLPMYAGVLASKGLSALGFTAFPYPAAVNSEPYDGRPACVDCGFCTGYGCASNAKGSPAVTMLRKALLTGNVQLLSETRAVRLLTNGTGSTVTGVNAIAFDGSPVTFTADRYVLAASPIEDARLLFLSGGIGNSSDQVGRNLMFHLETNAVGVFDQRVHGHRGRAVNTGFADFRGVAGDSNHPLAGIVEIGGGEGVINEVSQYSLALSLLGGFNGTKLKKLMRQSPLRDHLVAFTMHGEDAPQPTNRVDLDPAVVDLDRLPVARVTYSNHAFELAARKFYAPKFLDVFQAAGARYALVAPPDAIPSSAHIMGTLRFGNDPTTSVCLPTGRFHDIGNLYASDGSLLPTSSGFNPTLTIVALSARVAGEMLFPGSPEQALTGP
jgi:choline dehydrogenase-like flavoprotein